MRRMRILVTAGILALLCSLQVWAGGWKDYGVDYTYYTGTPGNTGAVCNAEVKGGYRANEAYELYIDGTIARNQWIGIKRPEKESVLWTYFDETGKDCSGWKEIAGQWYYFGNGILLTGWHRIDQQYYYFDPVSGIMKTSGTEKRDGVTYEFASDGTSCKIDGLKDAGENGTEGWKTDNGKYCYMRDGEIVRNEWLYDGDRKYYVGEDGAAYTGWREVDGSLYYFDQLGRVAVNGMMYENERKYSFDAEGRATELPMDSEEKMIYSNALKWCKRTYLIYTKSMDYAEVEARAGGRSLPRTEELLQRDWGITTKEQCEAMIQTLMEAGTASTDSAEKAWNFARAMSLCEDMQRMNWVTLAERVDMQLEIAPVIQASFSSWEEYDEAYMKGFRAWAGNSELRKHREKAYQTIKGSDYDTKVTWDQSLTKTW